MKTQQQELLERVADLLERETGRRVVGGRVTPDAITFRLAPEPLDLRAVEAMIPRIPPNCATLGINDVGEPLLVKLAADAVGSVAGPVAMIRTIVVSLATRCNGGLRFTRAADARRIVERRERAGAQWERGAVVLVGDAGEFDADLLMRGPAVGVFSLAAGDGDGLPFGLRIRNAPGCDVQLLAVGGGEATPVRFTPALVGDTDARRILREVMQQ